MVTSRGPTYHRVVVYLIIVLSLRPLHAKIYNCTSENANKDSTSICLLLVIVMESMKSNVSVNYVEGIQ